MSDQTELAVTSPALQQLFGTRAELEEQKQDEAQAIVGVAPLAIWVEAKAAELAKQAGGKAVQWASSKLLEAIGIGGGTSELEEIKDILNKVYTTQQKILDKVDALLREMQYEQLITRSFESVKRIASIYDRLLQLTKVPESERPREAERLKDGILDANSGVLVNLKIIHDVLVGDNPLNPGGRALLDLFMERWKAAYTAKQLSPDVPLSDYPNKSYDYLHGLFLVQYMGLSELANARMADKQYTMLQNETEQILRNLKQQQEMVDKWIPKWTLEWPQKFFDERWYVIKPRNTKSPKAMYGSPATGYIPLDYTVQIRERHYNNADEEWQFIKTGKTDTFNLRVRSRSRSHVSREDGYPDHIRMNWESEKFYDLRFVMSPKGDPVIGITNTNQGYLRWLTRDRESGLFGRGSHDQAEVVDVEYCGH
jgi:hypothetical protein